MAYSHTLLFSEILDKVHKAKTKVPMRAKPPPVLLFARAKRARWSVLRWSSSSERPSIGGWRAWRSWRSRKTSSSPRRQLASSSAPMPPNPFKMNSLMVSTAMTISRSHSPIAMRRAADEIPSTPEAQAHDSADGATPNSSCLWIWFARYIGEPSPSPLPQMPDMSALVVARTMPILLRSGWPASVRASSIAVRALCFGRSISSTSPRANGASRTPKSRSARARSSSASRASRPGRHAYAEALAPAGATVAAFACNATDEWRIKLDERLAVVGYGDTFLAMEAASVYDLADYDENTGELTANPIGATSHADALAVANYTKDRTPPTLTSMSPSRSLRPSPSKCTSVPPATGVPPLADDEFNPHGKRLRAVAAVKHSLEYVQMQLTQKRGAHLKTNGGGASKP